MKYTQDKTVTLIDAAEGRTLEVPASAVHEMEYPADSIYCAMKPNYQTSICTICSAVVVDPKKHTDFHRMVVK